MAEKRDYTPHQQRIIRRYYANQDGIRTQALADLVSDLYLATTDAKRASLWKRAQALLEGLGFPASVVLPVVENRDLRRLADLAAKGFQQDRRADWAQDAREDRTT
jgi:hypothetical protein